MNPNAVTDLEPRMTGLRTGEYVHVVSPSRKFAGHSFRLSLRPAVMLGRQECNEDCDSHVAGPSRLLCDSASDGRVYYK